MSKRTLKHAQTVEQASTEGSESELRALHERVNTAEAQMKAVAELVGKLMEGMKSMVERIEKSEAHIEDIEKRISKLPDDLSSAFQEQGRLIKQYIDQKLQQAPQQEQEGMIAQIFKLIREFSGGNPLNLLRGSSENDRLLQEIQLLEKEWINRMRLQYRDTLRRQLGLPPASSETVVVQAP